jgi:hypothetical protein
MRLRRKRPRDRRAAEKRYKLAPPLDHLVSGREQPIRIKAV